MEGMETDVEGDDARREDVSISLDWKESQRIDVGRRTLVGRLISEKVLNKGTVVSMIKKGWNLQDGVDILEVGENAFIFTFDSEAECSRILKGRPWSILGCLLNIQEWIEYKVFQEFDFGQCPFWIQFHNIPLEGMSRSNAIKLGSVIGEVAMVEDPVLNGRLLRNFIRVRVVVDLKKPLIPGFWVPRPGLPRVWVTVKYERLQHFCYRCGMIGHESRVCKSEKRMSIMNPDESMFGAWLSTVPVRNFEDALFFYKQGWSNVEGKKKTREVHEDASASGDDVARERMEAREDREGGWKRDKRGNDERHNDFLEKRREEEAVLSGSCGTNDKEGCRFGNCGPRSGTDMDLKMDWTGLKVEKSKKREGQEEFMGSGTMGCIRQAIRNEPSVRIKVEEQSLLVEEVGSCNKVSSPSSYIVEVPSDEEDMGGMLVPFQQHPMITNVVQMMRRVSLKRSAEEVSSPRKGKRVKICEKAISQKATVAVFARKNYKKGNLKKRNRMVGKIVNRNVNQEKEGLVEVPVNVTNDFPSEWFVFGRNEGGVNHDDDCAEGSGGCPLSATQGP